MAVFTSHLTRDALLTELGGNLLILETVPAPERRIRGAPGALSHDAGWGRLRTFWTKPLVEAVLATRLKPLLSLRLVVVAHNALRIPLPPACFASITRIWVRLDADLTYHNRSGTFSLTTRFPCC